MKQLVPFTPTNCDQPVAFVSPDLPDWIKGVIDNNWDKTSSGFGDVISCDDVINQVDDDTAELLAEMLHELREEYASQL